MKIARLVLFLGTIGLFLGTAASADWMSRRDSIRVAAWLQLNIPSGGTVAVTTAGTNDVINQMAQLISSRLPAVEKLDTVVGSSDSSQYSMNADFRAVHAVIKLSGDSMLIPLSYTIVDSIYDKAGGIAKLVPDYESPSQPRFAWSFASKLFFVPKPQFSDTFFVEYYAYANELNSDTAHTNLLPDFRMTLLNGVCARLAAMQGQFDQATWYLNTLPAAIRDEVVMALQRGDK